MNENIIEKNNIESTHNFFKAVIAAASQSLPEITLELDVTSRTFPTLRIQYPEGDRKDSKKKLILFLEEQGLVFGELVGAGSGETYALHQKRINGKVNWRRWVHYPNALSYQGQDIVNRIVTDHEEIAMAAEKLDGDGYDKLDLLIEEAFKEGVISTDDKKCVSGQWYAMAHGTEIK